MGTPQQRRLGIAQMWNDMEPLSEIMIDCPYCGETINLLVDAEEAENEYIEDCQVCCRPITVAITANVDGGFSIAVRSENETY